MFNEYHSKITKSILIAAITLVLIVTLSSSQLIGSAFAQTSIGFTNIRCFASNLPIAEKTCTGNVTGLQPSVSTCTSDVKKNQQTGQIIGQQTPPKCTQTSSGTSGTVTGTITWEQVTFQCINRETQEAGPISSASLQPFTTSPSNTVSGGTQQIDVVTTRIVGQGQGSQGPGQTVTTPGPITGDNTQFKVTGAPPSTELADLCPPVGQAQFTTKVLGGAEQDQFSFTPA